MIRDPILVESALEPALHAVASKEPAERKTAWITVSVLIGAGVIAATQIGKGIISLPTLQDEFALAYGRLSLVVSMFALLGATVGSLAGIAVQRFTPRRCLIAGMLILGAANLLGSMATLPSALIALRITEGVGFFGVIISVPSMLNGVTGERDRSLVMFVWGAYLPSASCAWRSAIPFSFPAAGEIDDCEEIAALPWHLLPSRRPLGSVRKLGSSCRWPRAGHQFSAMKGRPSVACTPSSRRPMTLVVQTYRFYTAKTRSRP